MSTDPRDGSLYRIPLGLLYAKGHSAAQVCAMTKSLMVLFGFSSKHLFHSVNDNTNSAVLAGKYILEHRGQGKCDRHKTNLVLKHATGLVVRTCNKQTIDSNPSFTTLYKTIHEFASWLMNKVAHSRYNNLKQYCATKNRQVIEIPLPKQDMCCQSFNHVQSLDMQQMGNGCLCCARHGHLQRSIQQWSNGNNYRNLRQSLTHFSVVRSVCKLMTLQSIWHPC